MKAGARRSGTTASSVFNVLANLSTAGRACDGEEFQDIPDSSSGAQGARDDEGRRAGKILVVFHGKLAEVA